MRRAFLQLLGLLAALPCFGQRAPTRSPASPTDSLRAAWTPESITVDRPHGPTGLDSPAVIRFHNGQRFATGLDRKSTRLNSSHDQISYAVFCLKQKKH